MEEIEHGKLEDGAHSYEAKNRRARTQSGKRPKRKRAAEIDEVEDAARRAEAVEPHD